MTLNTAVDDDAAVVGLGIDRDRSGGAPVAWPHGAGISSPGLGAFVTAWGTGGKVTFFDATGAVERSAALPDGAVAIDLRTNQMTVRVPRSLLDPARATWRYVAGVGQDVGEISLA